jgi:hypothetical protein
MTLQLTRCFAVDIQLWAYFGKVNELTLLDGPQSLVPNYVRSLAGNTPRDCFGGDSNDPKIALLNDYPRGQITCRDHYLYTGVLWPYPGVERP